MQDRKVNWLIVVVLALALAFPLSLMLQGQRRRYPRIFAAQRALQEAQIQLAHAAHHFGGHRVEAMRLIRQARVQLRMSVRWANHH